MAIVLLAVVAGGLAAWWVTRPALRIEPVTMVCNGWALRGDVYLPRRVTSDTAILLLHGSTARGRGLTLYKELAARLCRHGFIVCNLDQRGYNESDGPKVVSTLEDLDFVSDARDAARELVEKMGSRGVRKVAMVGHSFGGGVAVAAGLSSDDVAAIVSISPGRRIRERFSGNLSEKNGLRYVQKRRTADLGLEEPIPLELVEPMLASYDVEQFRGARSSKPLLFVEGDREPADDMAFMKDLAASMTGPVEHRIIPDAAHYFGTEIQRVNGEKRWVVVREPVLDELVAVVAGFVNSASK